MRRWAFNLFCLVSLMIFVASVAAWIRGRFSDDTIEYCLQPSVTHFEYYDLATHTGKIEAFVMSGDDSTGASRKNGWAHYQGPPSDSINPLFFSHRRIVAGPLHISSWALSLPLWLFLPFGIPPVVWWRKRRKNRGRGFPVQAGEPNAGGT